MKDTKHGLVRWSRRSIIRLRQNNHNDLFEVRKMNIGQLVRVGGGRIGVVVGNEKKGN